LEPTFLYTIGWPMTNAYRSTAQRLLRLELLRRKMEKVGREKGLDHPFTLALSRRLDELIVEVQREG
jgi:hypothetical protein